MAAEESRLDQRRAASGKRVIDARARPGESLDEEPRQLRLEAGAIGDFVQGMRLPLLGGPELVLEHRDAVRFRSARGASEGVESSEQSCEPGAIRRRWRCAFHGIPESVLRGSLAASNRPDKPLLLS
jgi:hypothetical protein